MIPEIGLFCFILSILLNLLISVQAVIVYNYPTKWQIVTNIFIMQWISVLISLGVLIYSFLQSDFSLSVVFNHSHTELSNLLKFSGVWAGQEGSMFMWYFWLSTIIILNYKLKLSITEQSIYNGIISIIACTLGVFILATCSPFIRILPEVPLQGVDLNPLLQDNYFAIHPPIIMAGYAFGAAPFAYAMLYLLNPGARILHNLYISALFANLVLAVGIILGGKWAYTELGWGGWWYWDPVENASLVPWLLGVVLVHSSRYSRHNNNYYLITFLVSSALFLICILSTMLVRSGSLVSVHAFATALDQTIGLLVLFSLYFVGSFLLILIKYPKLKLFKQSIVSNNSIFIVAMWILLLSAILVVFGTILPVFYKLLYNKIIILDANFFNKTFNPIFLLAIGFIPFIFFYEKRNIIVSVIMFLLLVNSMWLPLLSNIAFTVSILVLGTSIKSIWVNPKLILAACAHSGIAIAMISIVWQNKFDIEKEFVLSLGEKVNLSGYVILFDKVEVSESDNHHLIYQAIFSVITPSGKNVLLKPEKRLFYASDLSTSETDLVRVDGVDLMLSLAEGFENNKWEVRFYARSGVIFMWYGALLTVLAMIIQIVNKIFTFPRLIWLKKELFLVKNL